MIFGERYETIPKRRENCDEPEEYVAGYTEVFYTDGLKAEQGSGASAFQAEMYAIPRSGTYFA